MPLSFLFVIYTLVDPVLLSSRVVRRLGITAVITAIGVYLWLHGIDRLTAADGVFWTIRSVEWGLVVLPPLAGVLAVLSISACRRVRISDVLVPATTALSAISVLYQTPLFFEVVLGLSISVYTILLLQPTRVLPLRYVEATLHDLDVLEKTRKQILDSARPLVSLQARRLFDAICIASFFLAVPLLCALVSILNLPECYMVGLYALVPLLHLLYPLVAGMLFDFYRPTDLVIPELYLPKGRALARNALLIALGACTILLIDAIIMLFGGWYIMRSTSIWWLAFPLARYITAGTAWVFTLLNFVVYTTCASGLHILSKHAPTEPIKSPLSMHSIVLMALLVAIPLSVSVQALGFSFLAAGAVLLLIPPLFIANYLRIDKEASAAHKA